MTAREKAVWIAVYAASWHHATALSLFGSTTDTERARWCAQQADRALAGLRRIEHDRAPEVLA